MKKHIQYLFIVLLVTMISCKDFLREEPESFVAPENLFTSESGALAAVNGVYASLGGYRGGKTALIGNLGTDEVQIGIDERSQAATTGVDDYGNNLNPVNTIITSFWNTSYFIVVRANLVIEKTPAVPGMSDQMKDRVVAEARFLRALAYLNLATYYGGVPLTLGTEVEKDNPRATLDEIYSQIFEDLLFASENLPDKGQYSNADKGRATKQAALALHAKALMSAPQGLRDHAAAAAKAKAIIDFSEANPATLGLEPDFATLFTPGYENGLESIFDFQFFGPDQTNDLGVRYGSRYNGMTDLTIPGSGYADARPTDYVYDLFNDADDRKAATFRTEFFTKTGDLVTSAANPEYLKPHAKKFEDPSSATQTRCGRNIMYIRYADILLLYAEALLQSGGADPLTPINQVRERAGLDPLDAITLDVIMEERARELAFEGWRWFDLKRNGKLIEYVTERHPYAVDISETKTLYPIPQAEILTNEGIDQSDQNPGY